MLIDKFEKYYHYFHDEGYVFRGHRHNSFEVNIVLDGCLEVTCRDNVCRLSEGDLFIWGAGIFHRNRVLSEGVTEFISLHFCSADTTFSEPTLYKLRTADILLVKVLDDEISQSGGKITLAAETLLEALLLRLDGKSRTPELLRSKSSAVYHRAVTVMTENIGERLSIRQLSQLCGVCATSLKTAFSECAGKGVKEYFLDMKLEKAKQMLVRGVPVNVVASTLGFSSPAYFSQCFKRECGVCASTFKKNK